jgi:hypothetical protein
VRDGGNRGLLGIGGPAKGTDARRLCDAAPVTPAGHRESHRLRSALISFAGGVERVALGVSRVVSRGLSQFPATSILF